jgi:ribosomal protein S18 acetylase RimI-like enzyme
MAALRDAGYQQVHLSVDSDNQSGALQLYESVGFRVDSRMIVYMRVVEPVVAGA